MKWIKIIAKKTKSIKHVGLYFKTHKFNQKWYVVEKTNIVLNLKSTLNFESEMETKYILRGKMFFHCRT